MFDLNPHYILVGIRRCLSVLTCTVLLTSCSTTPDGPPRVVGGVDIDALFSPATPAEIAAILDIWEARDLAADNVTVVATAPDSIGTTPATLRVISHTLDGNRHYGAVIVPEGAAAGSLPVLIFAHESDQGVNLDLLLPFADRLLSDLTDDFVIVVPSYRSEPLTAQGITYRSDGEPSPWDRDGDDLLALLDAALSLTPAADPERIAVFGYSRGATVAMLIAARDPRIDAVACFAAPTDFLGEFIEGVTRDALDGVPSDLPNFDVLNEQLIAPLQNDERTIAEIRSELIRRSPVYFAEQMPALQMHHGHLDNIVPPAEMIAMQNVMEELGRTAPEFEGISHAFQGHSIITFNFLDGRNFLKEVLGLRVLARQ
jgi:dipeptidyl aminopeptidase/acylaminoacyl peptidase